MKALFLKLLFLFGLCLAPQLILAQYLVKGTLYDSKTREVLPFAPVVPLPSQKGTLTNGEGYYEIRSKEPVQQIQATYMGYESQTVSVPDPTKKEQVVDVFLVPLPIMLQEVVVTPQKLEDMIRALYLSLKAKAAEQTYAEAFYRGYSSSNGVPHYALEVFYKMVVNQSGIGDWTFVQGREAQSKQSYETPSRDIIISGNLSWQIRQAGITEFAPKSTLHEPWFRVYVSPICQHPEKEYVYKKVGEKMVDNETVSVINFHPRINHPKVRFSGTLEVIEDKLQIVSLEMTLDDPDFFVIIMGKRIKSENVSHRHLWKFNKFEGAWHIERIESSLRYFFPSTLDKNRKIDWQVDSQLVFYRYISSEEYRKGVPVHNEIDYTNLKEIPYDPEFWQKNIQTLSEIPFEQSVKKSLTTGGFYGNMFPGGISSSKRSGCSELQNSVMDQINRSYYAVLSGFVQVGVANAPEEEVRRFMSSEVRPLYDAYMDKVAKGALTDKQMSDILSYLKNSKVSDYSTLWLKFDSVKGKALLQKVKQYQKKNR